jgi:hypothetical protein
VLGFEITDGVERIQEIVESLKQLCSISIENVQPVLPITDHETRKLVGDEKPAGTSKKKSK